MNKSKMVFKRAGHRHSVFLMVAALLAGLLAASGPASAQDRAVGDGEVRPGETCEIEIEPVSVGWLSGSAPQPNWVASKAEPELLFDGPGLNVGEEWVYYSDHAEGDADWILIDFGQTVQLEQVSFNNGPNGRGSWISLSPDGSNSVSVSVDWGSVPGDTWATLDYAYTTDSTRFLAGSHVKINELRFCGRTEIGENPPIDPVRWNGRDCAFDWDDYDVDGIPADSYTVSLTGGLGTVTTTESSFGLTPPVPNGSYTVTVTATGPFGVSQPGSETIVIDGLPCGTDGPSAPCGPSNHPADRFCDSVHIIDSFGDDAMAIPVDQAGPQWNAVIEYHDKYGGALGQCSIDVHAKYWVLVDVSHQMPGSIDIDNDGDFEAYYPTGHTGIDGETGCEFGHEHGDAEPHEANIYDEDAPAAIGVPFGYLHAQHGNSTGRMEDHVGHKVIIQNDWTPVVGNPFGSGTLTPTDMTCDWQSKIHQGSYSSDALAENIHEYFLNVDCSGGDSTAPTHLRLKELVTWGTRDRVFIEESTGSPGLECATADDWIDEWNPNDPFHHLINYNPPNSYADEFAWIRTGFESTSGIDVTQFDPNSDGKREFACVYSRIAAGWTSNPQGLQELWKPDGAIKLPNNGGSINFSPYYITKNPARYVDPMWKTSGGTFGENAMFTTVDLCVKGSRAYEKIAAPHPNVPEDLEYPVFCNVLDASLQDQWEAEVANGDTEALSLARRTHPDSPFNGTRRGVHPKSIDIYGNGSSNYQVTTSQNSGLDVMVFCTNAMGDGSVPATELPDGTFDCGNATLQQASVVSNNWNGINGSSVGQIPNGPTFTAAGQGNEWIIDMSTEPGVQYPN